MMKIRNLLTMLLAVLLLISVFSSMAVAGAPPAPPQKPTPTPQPAAPSGGGGGGYSPPVSASSGFQPYTVDLKAGDGSTIGNLTGIDYFTVRLAALRNASLNNESYSLLAAADLNSKPEQATFDINLGVQGKLPEGMNDVTLLAAAIIDGKSAYGWSFKGGQRLTFTLPSAALENASATCYIVRYDGQEYQIVEANVTVTNGTVTLEAPVQGLWGTFTVISAHAALPVATPTPTPVPTALPAPTATPAPEPAGLPVYLPLIATFVIGLAAGAGALLIITRR